MNDVNYLKANFTEWTNKNEKIDNIIQKMQSQSEKIIYEWIPYYQFNKINRISKYGPNSTIYSAEWKDGPLKLQNYHNNNIGIKNYVRESNKVIILRKLHNSKNITNDLLMYEV
jgi:hypothetical protein